jgi:hypothetical protein
MAENTEAPLGTTDAEHATTEICYCPHLGLYRYKRADGVDYMFDREQLVTAMAAYLREGDRRTADFMANLTLYARQYPHVVVILSPDGTYGLRKLEIPEDERASKIIDDTVKSTADK